MKLDALTAACSRKEPRECFDQEADVLCTCRRWLDETDDQQLSGSKSISSSVLSVSCLQRCLYELKKPGHKYNFEIKKNRPGAAELFEK